MQHFPGSSPYSPPQTSQQKSQAKGSLSRTLTVTLKKSNRWSSIQAASWFPSPSSLPSLDYYPRKMGEPLCYTERPRTTVEQQIHVYSRRNLTKLTFTGLSRCFLQHSPVICRSALSFGECKLKWRRGGGG